MTSRKLLAELRRQAEARPDLALVYWYVTEDDNTYVNLRNVRLLILASGNVHVLPGTVTRHEVYGQQLLFASRGLCRIHSGRRRGMIVEPHRLRVGEDAAATGLVKSLRDGSKPNSLRLSDDRDRLLVERLTEAMADAVELEELIPPASYIRAKSAEDLTVRLSGEVTKKLMDLDEYDKTLPMEDNFHNLVDAFAVMDQGQKLYPFDMVQGPGLVVVDMENAPPPLLVPYEALDVESKLLRLMI